PCFSIPGCWRGSSPAAGGRQDPGNAYGKLSGPQPLEGTLEDVAGRQLVDDFGAAVAADVGLDEGAGDGAGGEPFVPEHDGNAGLLCEIADEGAGRLGPRA